MKTLGPLRPILFGIVGFMVLNLLLTLVVTVSPLYKRFNFNYGNMLPAKLEQMQANDSTRLDVLFLGTSQTNNGFVTPTFEAEAPVRINGFNMGLPSNRYDVMLTYLKFHNHKYGKPKILLLEVSHSIQEMKDEQYYLPALYYRSILERDMGLMTSIWSSPLISWNVKKEMLLSSFSSLHQFRLSFSPVTLLSKLTDKVSEKLKGAAPLLLAAQAEPPATSMEDQTFVISADKPQKGWYPKEMDELMRSPEGLKTSLLEAKKYFIDTQKEISFEKLDTFLTYCKDEDISVVLVIWPNHPEYLKTFEHSPLSKNYQTQLAELLAKHQTPLIDLNQRMIASSLQPETLFSDPRHLTPEGAKLFTTELSRKVFEIPEIKQRFRAIQKTVLTYEDPNN